MSMRNLMWALVLGMLFSASSAMAAPIMYVHDNQGNLGTVDVATGSVSVIGNMGTTMTDIAFDPFGNLFGITFGQLFSINATTASSSLIGSHGVAGGNALVFGSDGTLYGAGFNSGNLFTINPASGATTTVGSIGFNSGGDLAFNSGSLYLASLNSELVRVNATTGAGTLVGSFGVPNVFGLATGENGVLYAVAGTSVYTVNLGTGALSNPVSFAGQGLSAANGESFFRETQVVPEPSLLALLAGGIGFALRRRMRRPTRLIPS
jgi:hypothetical protein